MFLFGKTRFYDPMQLQTLKLNKDPDRSVLMEGRVTCNHFPPLVVVAYVPLKELLDFLFFFQEFHAFYLISSSRKEMPEK